MATESVEYSRVLQFIRRVVSESPDLPRDERQREVLLSSLTLDLPTAPRGDADPSITGSQVITSGWPEWEGVMLLQPGPPAELRAAVFATTVRALRDLLLAFPAGRLGVFTLSGAWMLPTALELFEERGDSDASPAGTERLPHSPHSFRGVKRGSGKVQRGSPHRSLQQDRRAESPAAGRSPVGSAQVSGSKDPVLAQFRDLSHAAGRRERSQFIVEGTTLVQRAVGDGLPVDVILYTPELARAEEGLRLLEEAGSAGVRHFLLTEGLMGKVTTTRPVPAGVAAVFGHLHDIATMDPALTPTLLLTENVNNPENLGMVLRTADAAGAGGVVIIGEASDPFHKHCLRAARGAVGRIPLFSCPDPVGYLHRLARHSFRILGATAHAATDLYGCEIRPPVAVIVGNEQDGISTPLLDACTDRIRIPMAPGQDSLNVGVAAGVILYELLRQRLVASALPPSGQTHA